MTFKQRNGYGLHDLVQRSLSRGDVMGMSAGDEHDTAVNQAFKEATGRSATHEEHETSDGAGQAASTPSSLAPATWASST